MTDTRTSHAGRDHRDAGRCRHRRRAGAIRAREGAGRAVRRRPHVHAARRARGPLRMALGRRGCRRSRPCCSPARWRSWWWRTGDVAARDPDGTTEVAALVTLAAGVLAGLGHLALARAPSVAVTTLLLVEKSRVHSLVERMDDTAVRAGIRFAVMAVVLMPLLPDGAVRPARGRQAARAVGLRAVLLGHQLRRLRRAPLRRRPARLPGGRAARRHRVVDERDAVVLAREPDRRRVRRPAPGVRRDRRLHHAVRAGLAGHGRPVAPAGAARSSR